MENKIKELFRAKEFFHKELAKIPFEKKIEILVKLQKIANDIRSVNGEKKRKVWRI